MVPACEGERVKENGDREAENEREGDPEIFYPHPQVGARAFIVPLLPMVFAPPFQ